MAAYLDKCLFTYHNYIMNLLNKNETAFFVALCTCAGLMFHANTIGADKDVSNDLTLPAIKIDTTTALITKDYMGSIEGKMSCRTSSAG